MTRLPATRLLLATALLGVGLACSDDPLTEEAGDVVTAEVVGPTPISAAVIDITGVAAIHVEGGDVFTHQAASGLRAVVVLHAPGQLKLTLEPSFPTSMPSATLVDVADDSYETPTNLEAYDVVVGS